ncbi:hypothetical protein BGZ83_005864 [Gryganskiella cystojenkinii]|nr:hypothetical protein BGZ83_005864 [Gryganskiella cystojenkinii]
MSFNQKRSSVSSSFSQSVNPRRQSSYGHIMAGTGALPSAHTAAIKSSLANNNNNGSTGSKRPNSLLLNSVQSQHRNQTLKARVARMCPSLVHGGTPRRRRGMLVMLCAGGAIIMIYFLSVWDVQVSSRDLLSSYKRSTYNNHGVNKPLAVNKQEPPPPPPVVYKNPDGTDMDPKSIFMVRDFGKQACKDAFGSDEKELDEGLKEERDQNRAQHWDTLSRTGAWELSLGWKRALKQVLPNFKDYSAGWVGQGVVLTALVQQYDDDYDAKIEDLLLQIKLLRGLSTIPIEVWFESAADVTEDLHETLASWGTMIRALDQDYSTVGDAIVESSDNENVTGTMDPAVTLGEIEDFKNQRPSPGQLQKALTIAALINSGFEDIFFLSPTTLPMHSPRVVFQQDDYTRTGAVFWQHPTATPAHDNPIWPIIQADCIPHTHEQSWSAMALRHKDAWKSLFVAWTWLTSDNMNTYETFFGSQGNDILRLAWIANKRQYSLVDFMPAAGLVDLSKAKGEGIGCSVGSHLYPIPGATVLTDAKLYAQEQKHIQKLFQQSYRYGSHEEFFIDNNNVMLVDISRDSSLVPLSTRNEVSNDRHLNRALDRSLTVSKDPSRFLLTDAYAAGSDGRVCLRISRLDKGHRHD